VEDGTQEENRGGCLLKPNLSYSLLQERDSIVFCPFIGLLRAFPEV